MDHPEYVPSKPASQTMVRALQTHNPGPQQRPFQFGLATLFIATTVIAIELPILIWNPLLGFGVFAVTASVVTIHLSRRLWNSSWGRATLHAMFGGGVFFGVPVVGSFVLTLLYAFAVDGVRGVRGVPGDIPVLLLLLLLAAVLIAVAGISIGVAALIAYKLLLACNAVCRTIMAGTSARVPGKGTTGNDRQG